MTCLHDTLPGLLREAAERHLLPRWRRLAEGEASEKAPGDWVTVVDHAIEAALTPALLALRPGSRVVGEEACAADPSRLGGLGAGEVWLLDPLDGTANFIAGRPSIALMVALLREGETVGAWLLNPVTGVLHAAERGGGAWRDGQRVHVPPRALDEDALVGVVKTGYLPEPLKSQVTARLPRLGALRSPQGCAGEDYAALARGEVDLALYWRTLPWDHAPGVLLLQEAGGCAARPDGRAWQPHDLAGRGLLAAGDAQRWRAGAARLGFG